MHTWQGEFEAFDFHPSVAAGLAAAGYETPTPIQARAIPQVVNGRDVMGLSQTGTGKTAAFALPIRNRLVGGYIRLRSALIIAPTRTKHRAKNLEKKTGDVAIPLMFGFIVK